MKSPSFEFGSPPLDNSGDADNLLDAGLARRLCERSPLGMLLADSDGRCVYSNAAYEAITGQSSGQALGQPWSDVVHPDHRERAIADWRKAMREEQPFRTDVRIRRPGERIMWARLNGNALLGGGKPIAFLVMFEDISDEKAEEQLLREAEMALFEEKERAQVTLASIGDAVLVTNLAGNVTYMNREAESLTGWSCAKAFGRPLREVFHIIDGETSERAPDPAKRAIAEDRTVELELGCVLVRPDGSGVEIEDSAAPIHNRDGSVAGAVIVFHDAAQSRAIIEQNAHLARHDHLTGLPNITLLTERLTQSIGLAYRHGNRLGLLFIDIDGFKAVNDTYGHLVGDKVLKSVASRLGDCVRATDTVCRRGGDEFVILLSELGSQLDAAHLAEKVLAAIAVPHVLDSATVGIGASIGISIYPDDSEDIATLMHSADAAMYRAKATSIDGYCFAGAVSSQPAIGWRAGNRPRGRRTNGGREGIPHFLRPENPS